MKLIVATDFSPQGDRAVAFAAALARRLGDELEIVHAVEAPLTVPAEFAAASPELMTNLQGYVEQKLASLSAGLKDQPGPGSRDTGGGGAGGVTPPRTGRGGGSGAVTWKALSGLAEESLLGYANQQKPRVLVLGSHGRTGAARLFLGSVAERVIRRAQVPVLVVPEAGLGPAQTLAGGRPLKVVAGVDASPASDAALAWLRGLADETPCDLSLVHVYWPLREHARLGLNDLQEAFDADDEIAAVLERELRPRIDHALKGLPANLRLRSTLGREADPLAHEAELVDADLLVVGTNQGHLHWGGSTAVSTVRASRRPVLCIPVASQPESKRAARPPALSKVLVAVDLAEGSDAALAMAYQMLRAEGGVVELCHVVPPSGEADQPKQDIDFGKKLSSFVPAREHHAIVTRTSIVEGDSIPQAIMQTADRLGVDVIVMSSHGRSGIGRALLGSVAQAVAQAAKKPVMLVPLPPKP